MGTRLSLASWALLGTLVLLSVQTPAQSCADCNLDGRVDVFDALSAARIAVQLIIPSPTQSLACDVDSSGTINIFDALRTAQVAAMLPVPLSCPSPPPSTPPEVLSLLVTGGGGPLAGPVSLQVIVADAESDPVDLVLEFRGPGGPFQHATPGQGGSPFQSLPTSPGGLLHVIEWNSAADFPQGSGPVTLRLTPYDPGPGLPATTSLLLDNYPGGSGSWTRPTLGSQGLLGADQARFDARAVTLLDGRVLIVGGQSAQGLPAETLLYDPLTHTVTPGPPIPGGGRVNHLVHVLTAPGPLHGDVVVLGGFSGGDPLDDIELLDVETMTWSTASVPLEVTIPQQAVVRGLRATGKGNPSPSAYVAASNQVVSGPIATLRIPIGGGAPQRVMSNLGMYVRLDPDGDGDLDDTVVGVYLLRYIRDLDDECTVTQHPGVDGVAGTADDRLVVFGGVGLLVLSGSVVPPQTLPPGEATLPTACLLADAEIVDVDTHVAGTLAQSLLYDTYGYITQAGTWDSPGGAPRYRHGAAVLSSGAILVAGGASWGASFPPAAGGPDLFLTPAWDALVQGGGVDPLTSQALLLRPDPVDPASLTRWQIDMAPYPGGILLDPAAPANPGYVDYASLAPLPGGDALLVGGRNARTQTFTALSSCQRFHALGNGGWWGPAGSLIEERALHNTVVLPGGLVLAIGGFEGSSPVPSYELFRP